MLVEMLRYGSFHLVVIGLYKPMPAVDRNECILTSHILFISFCRYRANGQVFLSPDEECRRLNLTKARKFSLTEIGSVVI